jgi:citrate synthase
MTEKSATKGGLEGVIAADTAIGKIDGEVGELRYCGYLIKDLAENANFVEVAHLLWHGELPTKAQLDQLRAALIAARELPPQAAEILARIAGRMPPMDALRTVASVLGLDDVPGADTDVAANLQRSIRLTARFPTIVAAYDRLRGGKKVLAPRSDLSHASNFLYMLTGEVPSADVERMMDVCLVLHAEHGLNASTFAARVTAATLSDMYSSVTSAVGTLKGPLHGGANTEVMNMLLKVGSVDKAEQYVADVLARGQKVMGFGHRVYKVVDPRALILKEFSRRLAQATGNDTWFRMSEKIEAAVKSRKGLDVNVDFYSASAYYYMGIKPDLFTTIFAISRIAGWTAHILEQYAHNRLIRPDANWIGAGPRSWVPVSRRG